MDPRRIKVRYADTGHWMARCDHSTGVIELNRREYPKLSPIFRDYIWCHEYIHLLCDIYDEAECNRIVNQIFVGRAKNDSERRQRLQFLMNSESRPNTSGMNAISWGLTKLIGIVVDISTNAKISAQSLEANEKSGFNALSEEDQRAAVDIMLSYAFRKARRSSTRTAQNFFMAKMEPYLTPLSINSYAALVSRYKWIANEIGSYEKRYGFGFTEIKPADNKDLYLGAAAALVLLIIAGYLIFKHKFNK